MLGNSINRIKSFFNENPKAKRLLGVLFLLLAIPITVIAVQRVQNLLQHAGGGYGTLAIVDAQGTNITRASDPNVYLMINLPSDWTTKVTTNAKKSNISLATEAFAQTSTSTDLKGGGCHAPGFDSDICTGNPFGAGGVCEFGSSQDVSLPCTKTCPDGSKAQGTSISSCNPDGCYYSSCFCSAQCPTDSVIATPAPVVSECGPTSDGTWTYACDCTTQSGAPGHHATRICSNGGVWTDPTCYEGLYLCKGGTPVLTPTPESTQPGIPNPQHVLKSLYITNSDTDGSSGGSDALNITQGFDSYLNKPIPWRLNSLVSGQNEASRIVQVTLYDGITLVPYVATVTLFRTNQGNGILSRVEVSFDKNSPGCTVPSDVVKGYECGISALAYDSTNFPIFNRIIYQWGLSSLNSIGTLSKTEGNITTFYGKSFGSGEIWVIATQASQSAQKSLDVFVVDERHRKVAGAKTMNVDINKDGKVDQKDIDILLSEFGRKGFNLPADLNRDGTVDGKDYNLLIKNK